MSRSGAQQTPQVITVGDFDPQADKGIEFDFIGREIAGRYTVRAQIGGGGMADVYRATDEQLGIDVALKLLKPRMASDELRARMVQEAQAAAQVRHANLVRVFGTGALDSTAYIVMELLGGPNLEQYLQEYRGGRMPCQEALELLLPALDALHEIHERGYVHRDIKTGNIIVTRAPAASPSRCSPNIFTTSRPCSPRPQGPRSGDGQLDPGETCDPGISQLSQTGACTLACATAKCGDNLVWAGKEACDDGPGNNDNLYGGCTTQCQLGPRCNDGEIQGPEECDFANGTGEFPRGGVPCEIGCRFHAKLAFITSSTYKGGEIGGVEGAHIKCQNLAKQAKYDNATNFMAWISDAQHSPFQDFTKTPNLPYVRPDGVRVADDWDDLVLNGPIEGIIVTDTGEALLAERVWTGTAPSGKVFDPAAHCQSWTSFAPAEKSRVGNSGIDKAEFPQPWAQWVAERHWTSFISRPCVDTLPLYCIEQ